MRLLLTLSFLLVCALAFYFTTTAFSSGNHSYNTTTLALTQFQQKGDKPAKYPNPSNNPDSFTTFDQTSENTTTTASLPKALAGTQVPINFSLDDNGNLNIDGGVKQFFDYFLLLEGTGETNYQNIQALMDQYLTRHLTEPALSQALHLMDRYSSYRHDLNDLMLGEAFLKDKQKFQGGFSTNQHSTNQYTPDQLAKVHDYYDALSELKTQYFDQQERHAFFADEERYTDYMLERMNIANSTLNKNDKQQRLANLDQQQKHGFMQQRQRTHSLENVKSIMQETGDRHQKQQTLSDFYGEEKASAILEVEQNRQSWKSKKSQYFSLKQSIAREHPYYSANDINRLMDSYMATDLGFSEPEIKRMQILEGR